MMFPATNSLILSIFLLAPGAQQNKPTLVWENNYEAAVQKATKEKKPILIAVIMDNEPANDETVRTLYTDSEIGDLGKQMICMIANSANHGPDSAPCPKFGSLTCSQHQAIEKKMRATFIKAEIVRAPQHIFCTPTGAEMFRKVFQIGKGELKKAMSVAIATHSQNSGLDLAKAEKEKVDKALKDADSKNVEVRSKAFEELATADDPRGIPALLEKAKPNNAEVDRYMSIYALGKKGNYGAIKPLMGFLQDNNVKIAIYAIHSIGETQLPDPVPEILSFVRREKNDRLRGHSVRALAKCAPESPAVQKIILEFLKDGLFKVQQACLMAAYDLKPDPKVVAALQPFLESKNANLRGLAVWVAGTQKNPALNPVLEKMSADDKDPSIREVAAKALAFNKGEKIGNYPDLYKDYFKEEDFEEANPERGGKK